MRTPAALLLLVFPGTLFAQAGPAVLRTSPAIHSEVAALPRVSGGIAPEVAEKINASLERFDAEVRSDWRECAGTDKTNFDWSRTVTVTMRGPDYLSVLIEDGFMCSGMPHPEDSELTLVYDLHTGSPVNWERLLPPEAKGHLIRSKGRLTLADIRWPAMVRRAREEAKKSATADDDCSAAFADENNISFNAYLSAKEHAVVLAPILTPHYVSATCSTTIVLGADEAAKMGVASTLIRALRSAQ